MKRLLAMLGVLLVVTSAAVARAEIDSGSRTAEEMYQSGEYDAARERLRAAIAADASDARPYLLLGLVELRRNDAAAAAAAWARYEELSKDPRSALEIGKVRTIVGREAAERAAKEAVNRELRIGGEGGSPRTVAVATFQNAGSAQYAMLGKALAAMLIDNLLAVPGVTVLEREQMEALEAEAKLSATGLAEKGTAVRAGRLLRAGRVAAGSHADTATTPPELGVDALLVDVSAAKTLTEAKSQAPASEFYKLIPALATKLAAALGSEPSQLPSAAKARLEEEHTRSLAAVVAFGRALDGLDRHDVQAALEACKAAEREDPNFRLAKEKCAFVPPVWLSTQGVVAAVEPIIFATTRRDAGGIGIWGPVLGALVAGGVAGGTYVAVSRGSDGGHGTPVNGNNSPQLNGVADRTVGAGQTTSLDLSCRDPDGTTTTIANPQKGPGASFTQTSGNPSTARYQQPTNANEQGQSFAIGFTCTDSGTPPSTVTANATIRVVAPAAVPTVTPTGKPKSPPASSTALPTPGACNPLTTPCVANAECCTNACAVPEVGGAQQCCVPHKSNCSLQDDCCNSPLGTETDCVAGVCCYLPGSDCTTNADCCAGSVCCPTGSCGALGSC